MYYAIGNVTIDDLVFHDGETRMGTSGGNAAFAALGVRVWGAPVGLVAQAGPDYPVGDLEALGVDTRRLERGHERSLRNWGLYEADGRREFLFRGGVRWEDYSPSPEALPDVRGCHCHLSPLPIPDQRAWAASLRASGAVTVTLDPDYRLIHTLGPDGLSDLLATADAFLPSRQEIEILFPDRAPAEALATLRALAPGADVIAVKLDAEGVIVHQRRDTAYWHVPALSGNPVDPTGAGDAFCGGFLYGYARTRSALDGALHGAVSASFAVEGFSFDGFASREPNEAEARLRALRGRMSQHPLPQPT